MTWPDPTRPPLPPLPEPERTPEDLRWHYGLKPLPSPGVGIIDGRPVQTWASWSLIARPLIEDVPVLKAVVQQLVEGLYAQLAEAEGCKWAGDPVVTLHEDRFPVMLDDDRSRLRRLWDRIRRRTWTPPEPPYMLRAEVRAA